MSVRNAKWKNVLCYLVHATDECELSDPDKLHDSRFPIDDHAVTNLNVTRKLRIATDDYVITHDAIVSNVAVGEKYAIAPYYRGLSLLGRGIDGRVLAEHVAATDAGEGYGTSQKFPVFSLCPQTRKRVNFIAIPKGGVATDDNIGTKHVSATEDDIRSDVTIGANPATCSDFSARFNNRRGMDAAGHRRHFGRVEINASCV